MLLLLLLPGGHGTSTDTSSGFQELARLEELVHARNACQLPGCSINYECFMPVLMRAVSRGYVKSVHAQFVADGLRNGFSLGVSADSLRGQRVFRNYPTAYTARDSVTESVRSRVDAGRTLVLGPWSQVKVTLYGLYKHFFIFPMGAVPKPHQPSVMRPTSDHSRTGLNAATVMGILGHSLDTYKRVAWLLNKNYFMYVSDVADAFMLIPLAPWLWAFFLFRWAISEPSNPNDEDLLVHLMGDFGSRGLPGTFKIFLVDVVVQMARSEFVLTLPLVIYVDDAGLISEHKNLVDTEMPEFQKWSKKVCGVDWKALKDRVGSQTPEYIGFIWDSRSFTRCLVEHKVLAYLDAIARAADSPALTLRDRQSLAGKIQRAIMTFPPGAACLLTNCYILMSGLIFPWQKRRTTAAERADYRFVHDMLKLNVGKGYYRYDGFEEAPTVHTDASKSKGFCGGGWVSACGMYDYFCYGTSCSRKPIDELEGDVPVRALERLAPKLFTRQVPMGIDNQSFMGSARKGRSKVTRLNVIVKRLFYLQIRYSFIVLPFYIPTDENYLADHLSRGRLSEFLRAVPSSGFIPSNVYLFCCPDAGRTVTFDYGNGSMAALRQLLDTYSSNVSKDGPSKGPGVGGDSQLLSIPYSRANILAGLPPRFLERFDQVMDNRLADSSMSKVGTAVKRWKAFCDIEGWNYVLNTDDPERGGKIVAWILTMVDETELVYKSIETYVWGMRTWQVLQHQADPAFGVMNFRQFMASVAVLTAVPSEPREMFPLDVFEAMMESLDWDVFEQVQLGLICLVLLFTFSRTECPCPKAFTGPNCFVATKHWTVSDFKLVRHPSGLWVLWVRFKGIKQDLRMDRASARQSVDWLPFDPADGKQVGRDWVPIGDVTSRPHFSVSRFYMRAAQLLGQVQDEDDAMFLSRDRTRPLLYSGFISDLHSALARASLPKNWPHGIRVLGYNLSKSSLGADITQAHGGWLSSGHSRYERFSQTTVLGIGAGMLGEVNPFDAAAPRAVSRGGTSRAPDAQAAASDEAPDEAADDDSDSDASDTPDDSLPDGYTQEKRVTPSNRTYFVYFAPTGERFESKVACWRHSVRSSSSPVRDDTPRSPGPRSGAHRARRSSSPVRSRRELCNAPGPDGLLCTFINGHLGGHSFEEGLTGLRRR